MVIRVEETRKRFGDSLCFVLSDGRQNDVSLTLPEFRGKNFRVSDFPDRLMVLGGNYTIRTVIFWDKLVSP